MTRSFRPATSRYVLLAALAAAVTGFFPAQAAPFPDKPIRIVVPSSPGGSADAVARIVGARLSSSIGQAVVIENRGGGGGNIAAMAVANAAPDGYTLLLGANYLTDNPALYRTLPYRADDFLPVVEVTRGPSVFVAGPSAPFKTLPELIARAKAEPGAISYGIAGIGLPGHIAVESFAYAAKIRLSHVAYKGSGPALMDTMAGQIPMASATLVAAMPHIQSGKLKALAVTSAARWPSLPNVPTVAESGLPGYSHLTWLGLLAPKGTPAPVVTYLNREVGKILAHPEIKSKLELQGMTPVGGSVEALRQMMSTEFVASRDLVRKAQLTAQ